MEVYVVTIEHCIATFEKQIKKTEIKAFSTEELAISFLVRAGFIYGAPYPFKQIGWYCSKHINLPIDKITRFMTANITRVELDDESWSLLTSDGEEDV